MRGGAAGRDRVQHDAAQQRHRTAADNERCRHLGGEPDAPPTVGRDGPTPEHTVSESIDALVAAHLSTWNSPNGSDRQRAIAVTYTTDVTIGEPGARHTGHAGMDDAISTLHTQLPNTTITRTGAIQTAQELVTYRWELGTVGHPPIAAGRDVLLVVDGAITHVFVLVDAPEARHVEVAR